MVRSREARPRQRSRLRGSALGLFLVAACLPAPEEETTTNAGSTTTVPATTTTMAGTTSSTGELDHGLTYNEESTAAQDCEMFEFTEVDGCAEPVGQQFCSEGSAHFPVEMELEWEANPPHSGPHWPQWQSWGEHESTVEREYWVHNLEHGGIVLSYRCPGGCEADLEVLRTVMEMRPQLRILLTPDPELPSDGFAAISWTWVHLFETPDLDELLCFVDQHENHAPEDVP